MNLPVELQSTETVDVVLAEDRVVKLPMCYPKFSLWDGAPVTFDYGKKPVLNYKGEACFAELVILRILIENGWDGVWVESYGGTHFLRTMPNKWALKSEHVSLPEDKEAILRKIWDVSKTSACFDVFAWKGDKILLCEAKRSKKDKLTDAQKKFIAGALSVGISPESFLIVEWDTFL